jgi:hypothetical protein
MKGCRPLIVTIFFNFPSSVYENSFLSVNNSLTQTTTNILNTLDIVVSVYHLVIYVLIKT